MATSTNVNESKFCLTIDKINELVTLNSRSIVLQGLPWKIMAFRSGRENTLGLRLTCLGPENANWTCAATASFELLSFTPNQRGLRGSILPYIFSCESNQTSCTLIKWSDLFNGNVNYVQNNIAKIKIQIMTRNLKLHNKTNLQVVHRTVDMIKVRFTVHDASTLLAACSSEFDFCNLSWQLVVAGAGYRPIDRTKFGSMLWCVSKNTTAQWSRDIEGSTSFLTENNQSCIGSAKKMMKFNSKSPRKYFTDSILWNDLINPSKKYIRNDYIVLEVELKVPPGTVSSGGNLTLAPPTTELPCTICFESMVGRSIVTTRCGHMFCKTCITTWIVHRPSCPLCEHLLTAADLHPVYLP